MNNRGEFLFNFVMTCGFIILPLVFMWCVYGIFTKLNESEKEFWNNVEWVNKEHTLYHLRDTMTINGEKYLVIHSIRGNSKYHRNDFTLKIEK